MAKTKEPEFNPNPPLSFTEKKYVIYRNKQEKNIFMTTGGEYRSDFYEIVFQSDDMDELRDYYMKITYSPKKPL
jgi:hypothetical protein